MTQINFGYLVILTKQDKMIDYNEELPSLSLPIPKDSGPPLLMPIEPLNGPSIPNIN